MNTFCIHCGVRLNGPTCGACGQPDPSFGSNWSTAVMTAPSSVAARPRGSSRRALAIAVAGIAVAAAAVTALVVLRLFGGDAEATAQSTPTTSTVTAPSDTTVTVTPPGTVTVTRQAPAPADDLVDTGESVYSEVLACEAGYDGVHLNATVRVYNYGTASRDVLGTLTFTAADGSWLGQGGFSAAALPGGESIDTYVDTADPQDRNADQVQDAGALSSGMTCTVDSLTPRAP